MEWAVRASWSSGEVQSVDADGAAVKNGDGTVQRRDVLCRSWACGELAPRHVDHRPRLTGWRCRVVWPHAIECGPPPATVATSNYVATKLQPPPPLTYLAHFASSWPTAGTMGYQPPTITKRSPHCADTFSFGVMLYEMVTRRRVHHPVTTPPGQPTWSPTADSATGDASESTQRLLDAMAATEPFVCGLPTALLAGELQGLIEECCHPLPSKRPSLSDLDDRLWSPAIAMAWVTEPNDLPLRTIDECTAFCKQLTKEKLVRPLLTTLIFS